MIGNKLTPVVKVLLILNIGIFLLAHLLNFEAVTDFMALRYIGSSQFNVYQIITHMFMHGDIMHLFSNMFGLFMFGPILESIWGAKRFLIYYLVCGIGGAFCYMAVNSYEIIPAQNKIANYYSNPIPEQYELIVSRQFKSLYKRFPDAYEFNAFPKKFAKEPNRPELIRESKDILNHLLALKENRSVIGASGALFGILLGVGVLFPNMTVMLLFFPVPIKLKYFVTFYGLFELYSAIQNNPEDPVSHIAHIGGMIFGYLLILFWKKDRNNFY